MINITYPGEQQELEIMRRTVGGDPVEVQAVLDGPEVQQVQHIVEHVPVADHVLRYALALVRATRVRAQQDDLSGTAATTPPPDFCTDYLSWGAGPRASQYLVLSAKAKALLTGATHVTPEHIRAVIHPVLRHRLILNFNAEADAVTTDDIINRLVDTIPLDDANPDTRRQLDAVVKS